MSGPEDLKTLLARFMENIWNRGDTPAIPDYIASSYTIRHDPGDPWHGQTLNREGFAERLEASRAPFPDQRFVITEMVADEARVLVIWRWTGTHRGEVAGIPPTGRLITMTGMTVYYIEDGLLTGHWQEIDRLGVFRQLAAPA